MGKITEKLRKLGLTVNGVEPSGETISEIIDDIANDYTGGGATYTAGTGIEISNDEISIDENIVAKKTDIPSANYLYNVHIHANDFEVSTLYKSNVQLETLTYNDLVTYFSKNGLNKYYVASGYKLSNAVTSIYVADDMGTNKLFVSYTGGSGSLVNDVADITFIEL